ncbi:MAG: hypothetical protein ACTSV7_09835 [Candidatus Baldrarchaeia archaeon]
MSERGFVQFGGFKTRGFGAVRLEIFKVEKYRACLLSLRPPIRRINFPYFKKSS